MTVYKCLELYIKVVYISIVFNKHDFLVLNLFGTAMKTIINFSDYEIPK